LVLVTAPARGYSWADWEVELRESNKAKLRETLGEEGYERACGLGKTLSRDEACDLALRKTVPK